MLSAQPFRRDDGVTARSLPNPTRLRLAVGSLHATLILPQCFVTISAKIHTANFSLCATQGNSP